MTTGLPPCDYTCLGCGLITCRDHFASPGEGDRICADCYQEPDE